MILGYKDKEIKPLKFDTLIRCYTTKNYVVAEVVPASVYRVKQRIYQLNRLLPAKFIQISSSEIVNFNYVDHLKLVGNGTIKLILTNQESAYVSRRFVSNIKRRLGI